MTEHVQASVPVGWGYMVDAAGFIVPIRVIDVPVSIEPGLDRRGECRYDGDNPTGRHIVLREWDQRVLLHELLHVIVDPVVGTLVEFHAQENCHKVINAVAAGLAPYLESCGSDASSD